MNRWVEARRGMNRWVEARRGEGEFLRLAVVGLAKRKSKEMLTHPGGEEADGDNGFAFAPRCDGGQRKGFGQVQCEQMHQRVAGRSHLHPELQHTARLLPVIIRTPPAFEVLKK